MALATVARALGHQERHAEGLGGELRYEAASPGASFVLVIPA